MEQRICYVYILRCGDGTLYTGVAYDVARRLAQHNGGKGAKYLRGRLPVIPVYTEACPDRGEALRRELQIKALSKQEKERLIASQPHSIPK